MILIHRINGKDLVINCELIETVEQTPDTIITMSNGNKYVIQESVDEVVSLVIKFKNSCIYVHTDANRSE